MSNPSQMSAASTTERNKEAKIEKEIKIEKSSGENIKVWNDNRDDYEYITKEEHRSRINKEKQQEEAEEEDCWARDVYE